MDPRWLDIIHYFEGNEGLMPSSSEEMIDDLNNTSAAKKTFSKARKLSMGLAGVAIVAILIAQIIVF
jgi:hypothetical protein